MSQKGPQTHIKPLQNWIAKNSHSNVEVIEAYGLGLAASKSYRENTLLVEIPEENVFSASTIDNLAKGDPRLQAWLELAPSTGEAQFTLHRLHRAVLYFLIFGSTKWNAYLRSLPSDDELSLPFAWDNETIEQLRGTSIYEATISKRRYLESVHSQFMANKTLASFLGPIGKSVSLETWLLVYEWLASRCHTHPLTGDRCLLPIIDLINHGKQPNARYDLVDGRFVVVPADGLEKQIGPGDELFIDYGARGSGEFLFNYGFIPEGENALSLIRLYDPQEESIRSILDPSTDSSVDEDERGELAVAYQLIARFFPTPNQSLRLGPNKTWSDEFVNLLACEDAIELRQVEGEYGLYLENTELSPGCIADRTSGYAVIQENCRHLVSELARYFAKELPNATVPLVRQLAELEAKLYETFFET